MKRENPSRTDWRGRLAVEKPLQIKRLEKAFADIPAGATMVIVTPRRVDEAVKRIPAKSPLGLKDLRAQIARQFKADFACPVTAGISLRVVAEASYEYILEGKTTLEVTPFWRAIDPTSDLAGKLSCGRDFISGLRDEEGVD